MALQLTVERAKQANREREPMHLERVVQSRDERMLERTQHLELFERAARLVMAR